MVGPARYFHQRRLRPFLSVISLSPLSSIVDDIRYDCLFLVFQQTRNLVRAIPSRWPFFPSTRTFSFERGERFGGNLITVCNKEERYDYKATRGCDSGLQIASKKGKKSFWSSQILKRGSVHLSESSFEEIIETSVEPNRSTKEIKKVFTNGFPPPRLEGKTNVFFRQKESRNVVCGESSFRWKRRTRFLPDDGTRERERVAGGRRQENCKRWEAVGRKNRGSALVKEIIRGLIKYSAISSASIAQMPRPSEKPHLQNFSLSLRSFPFPSVSSSSRNHRGLGGGRIRISKIHAKLSALTRVKVEGAWRNETGQTPSLTSPLINLPLSLSFLLHLHITVRETRPSFECSKRMQEGREWWRLKGMMIG